MCNDALWPAGLPQRIEDSAVYVPCAECQALYTTDILYGKQLLDARPFIDYAPSAVVDYQRNGYPAHDNGDGPTTDGVRTMEMKAVPISTFARYFEATDAGKWRVVARALSPGMDYYWKLRNTLADTHWLSDDISTFEVAVDGLLGSVKSITQRECYRQVADSYIKFWKRYPGAHVFRVPTVETDIAGLSIRVNPEIRMEYRGESFTLKLYFRATPPTKKYRQAVQFLTARARGLKWDPNWQATLFAVSQGERHHEMPLPQRFGLAVAAQAAAFLHTWDQLSEEKERLREER
jgi:hypothetical protein